MNWTKKIWVMGVFLAGFTAANAEITNVSIVPSPPTPLDMISIKTSGVEGAGAVFVTDTDFRWNETLLELDIFLNVGAYQIVTNWTHTENIGILPARLYDLTVRTFEDSLVTDTYSMSFEVVPEPATLAIFGFALPFFRIFSKRKR